MASEVLFVVVGSILDIVQCITSHALEGMKASSPSWVTARGFHYIIREDPEPM